MTIQPYASAEAECFCLLRCYYETGSMQGHPAGAETFSGHQRASGGYIDANRQIRIDEATHRCEFNERRICIQVGFMHHCM